MTSKDEFTAEDYDALPEVLTPRQVALILNSSDVQVKRWATAGVIPGRRFGNRWRFSKSQLEQLIREGTPPENVRADDQADDRGEPADE